MTDSPAFPPKTWSELAAFLNSENTLAIMADPEFQRSLIQVSEEVSELAEMRRQAREIPPEVRHQQVSI